MKYIRTKNEVKAIETTLNSKELYVYLQQFSNYKDNLIKVCDTIEELFDEYVVDNIIFHTYGLEVVKVLKSNNKFGAIWTDKGLIYVAKMKGILPNGEIDWELL